MRQFPVKQISKSN